MAGGSVAVIDYLGILSDEEIRRYFKLGCEVKSLEGATSRGLNEKYRKLQKLS